MTDSDKERYVGSLPLKFIGSPSADVVVMPTHQVGLTTVLSSPEKVMAVFSENTNGIIFSK